MFYYFQFNKEDKEDYKVKLVRQKMEVSLLIDSYDH